MELTKIPHYLTLFFFVGGMYFLSKGIQMFVLWLLFVPTAWLFWKAVERQKVTLAVVMMFFLITLGIDPVFFYMRRERYTMTGWNAIGTFSFSAADFVNAYTPVLIMALSVYIFFCLMMPEQSNLILDYLKMFDGQKETWNKRRRSRACGMILCVLLVGIFIPLNIVMFEKGIGITGMVSPSFPYRLVGILHYFRLLVIPVITFILYVNSNNTKLQFACVLSYAFVSAFASASRSLFMINMIICVLLNVIKKDGKKIVASIVFILVMFSLIGVSRNYIYVYNYTGYVDLVIKVLKNFSLSQIESTAITTLSGISNRLFGMQYYVLAEQNGVEGGVIALLQYLMSGTFQTLVPDMSTSIFGLELYEGYTFGVAMGAISELLMIANGNYAMILLEAFLLAVLMSFFEKVINYVHSKSVFASLFCSLIFAYILLQFWFANLRMVYKCMGAIVICIIAVKVLESLTIFVRRKVQI